MIPTERELAAVRVIGRGFLKFRFGRDHYRSAEVISGAVFTPTHVAEAEMGSQLEVPLLAEPLERALQVSTIYFVATTESTQSDVLKPRAN